MSLEQLRMPSYFSDRLRVTSIEAHTAGEPLRVIVGGVPELPGQTILEKRRHAQRHLDWLRRLLMWEPRGHADMYGCILTPPVTPDADVGVLFLHNQGFSTMCGHGIIGLVKVGLECGLFRPRHPPEVRIDTPAGRVVARAHERGGRVQRVSFRNVPSFLLQSDLEVAVEGFGPVICDVAFGGAFYAYLDAESVGLSLKSEHYPRIIDLGRRIKEAVSQQFQIRHPEGASDLNFLYGTIFVEGSRADAPSRNVCVFADGEVDRSPTGTGVSGRAAIHYAKGELALGQPLEIESLIGTRFQVEVVQETTLGGTPAVIPRVTGSAYITGRSEFLLDPDDPLLEGFLLR